MNLRCLFRHKWSKPCAILNEWFGVECERCGKRKELNLKKSLLAGIGDNFVYNLEKAQEIINECKRKKRKL